MGAAALLVSPQALPLVTTVRVPRVAAARVQMGIEEMAQSCLEEGCPIDMVEDLIAEFELQADSSSSHDIVTQLRTLLESPEANRSEIEKLVAAAGRTFSVVEAYDFPGIPLGYSTKPSYGNKLDY